jgi:hypothetical protein
VNFLAVLFCPVQEIAEVSRQYCFRKTVSFLSTQPLFCAAVSFKPLFSSNLFAFVLVALPYLQWKTKMENTTFFTSHNCVHESQVGCRVTEGLCLGSVCVHPFLLLVANSLQDRLLQDGQHLCKATWHLILHRFHTHHHAVLPLLFVRVLRADLRAKRRSHAG